MSDALWSAARVRKALGCTVVEIAKAMKKSRGFVYNAIYNDVPPSERLRKNVVTNAALHMAARRRRVRCLAKKTKTITAKKKVMSRGRPRLDGTPRPFTYETKTIVKSCFGSPAQIARQLSAEGLQVSRSTVRRDLVDMGFKAYRRRPVCALTDNDKERRLTFCRRVTQYPHSWFTNCVFTDEKWFDANDSGVTYHWVQTNGNEAPRRDVFSRERSQAPAKVFVWGAIAVGWRCIVVVRLDWSQGGLKADEYKVQCLSRLKQRPARGRVLMQDGARIHWTKNNTEYIRRVLKMRPLEHWPPHSADLNPIEHMWSIVQRAVSARGPWGVEELEEYVVDEFNKVSDDVVERLVTSFERRVESVVKVRGAQLV